MKKYGEWLLAAFCIYGMYCFMGDVIVPFVKHLWETVQLMPREHSIIMAVVALIALALGIVSGRIK